jgi:hypothetical protein
MNKRGYFLVLCMLLGLAPAGALGQEAGAGEPVSEETAPVETPQEEPLPESDEVIDQIAGETIAWNWCSARLTSAGTSVWAA